MDFQPSRNLPSGLAFIGAGSNIGDRLDYLTRAARLLRESNGVLAFESAPVYETRPVGPAGPGNFYNTIFRLKARLSPHALWRRLQEIETALGRPSPRSPGRLGARTIDLDLLLYDDLIVQHEELTIPHPRLHARAFVLVPLCDLAPDLCHPELGLTMRELVAQLPPTSEIIGRVVESILAPVGAE
jgi:2-amino-4-hydroxy-6-hydroxymethyldihydropteridine diphosphokinase